MNATNTQTLAEQAESILSQIENNYPLQLELETYFKRRWEIATGITQAREALEERIAVLEESAEEKDAEFDSLYMAAKELIYEIDSEDAEGIKKAVKALEALL